MSKYADPGLDQMPKSVQGVFEEADAADQAWRDAVANGAPEETVLQLKRERSSALVKVRAARQEWRGIAEVLGKRTFIQVDGEAVGPEQGAAS